MPCHLNTLLPLPHRTLLQHCSTTVCATATPGHMCQPFTGDRAQRKPSARHRPRGVCTYLPHTSAIDSNLPLTRSMRLMHASSHMHPCPLSSTHTFAAVRLRPSFLSCWRLVTFPLVFGSLRFGPADVASAAFGPSSIALVLYHVLLATVWVR